METGKAILQQIEDPLLMEKEVKLFIKREDLIHPVISGNKWRKLKYNLLEAKRLGQNTLLTFGGAYSNHIYATAAAAKEADLNCIGIIRGEAHQPLNSTLDFAQKQGIQIHYVSRTQYRERNNDEFIKELKSRHGNFYLIPEGGSNQLAVKGCAEIIAEIKIDYDLICTPVGTGGTMAGLIVGSKGKGTILGFSALKGDFLISEVNTFLNEINNKNSNWKINTDYHFGGYAKYKPELLSFIQEFKMHHQIQLDPIYTGKMFFGLFDLIKHDYFDKGCVIVALHTGGLQGIEGFNKRYHLDL